MRKGKYAAPRTGRANAKVLATVLALTLALGCVVGGTIAWLTDTAGPIANTFTIGDINITLKETNSTSTQNVTFVPGQILTKDTTLTVNASSEPCYLFIHIKEENNTFGSDSKKVIEWTLNNADNTWNAVEGQTGYYYAVLDTKMASDKTYTLFTDNKLTVNGALTKSNITNMAYPVITITAAAVQKENIPDSNSDSTVDVTDAWALLPASFKPST